MKFPSQRSSSSWSKERSLGRWRRKPHIRAAQVSECDPDMEILEADTFKRLWLLPFFSDHIYFSISLQFYLNIKSYNILVNDVPAMQLKIVLDWEPVDNVWNSLGVAGATILVIQEEDTALKGLPGDQWSLSECIIMRWFLTPVFVLKRRTMSGPLSSVQVIKMWWKQF